MVLTKRVESHWSAKGDYKEGVPCGSVVVELDVVEADIFIEGLECI